MKVFAEKPSVGLELDRVTCNMCGGDIGRNGLGYFDDYLTVEKIWGYHSPMDGDRHAFDVCADCYRDWVGKFAIPPESETADKRDQ